MCWNGEIRGEEREESWKRQQLMAEKERGRERREEGEWEGSLFIMETLMDSVLLTGGGDEW